MVEEVARWRAKGLRVGFTNGCFDILHKGHVAYLAQARSWCDRLIVGLNSDESVRALKGEVRPVMVWGSLPILSHTLAHSPQFEPMKSIMARAQKAAERRQKRQQQRKQHKGKGKKKRR